MNAAMIRFAATLLLLTAPFAGGCATTQYAPQLVARGEITLGYDGGFVMRAEGKPVAEGLSYR
ncbi:MAG TPA: hypothetical protein PKO07_24955, partial [Pseudomonadota bacterium]|nr:hypothetical protein [Pseudomonadota bacterium]